MINFLDHWVADILENRADKSWEPSLYARADIALALGHVAGLQVGVNNDAPQNTLILMGRGHRDVASPAVRFEPVKAAGAYFEEMARYHPAIRGA